jgi:hypothetical protein
MRVCLLLAAATLAACANTYHPEYHPVTTVSYSSTNASPVNLAMPEPQPVYVMPSPVSAGPLPPATLAPVLAPAVPEPPTPPPNFPW